jgi:Ca-activated chloride channel family protein
MTPASMKLAPPVLLLVPLAGLVAGASQAQIFRSSVDMVAIYPLVTAGDGRIATNLRREDFTVLDNGRPAEIAIFSSDRQPITAGLLLDMSASMEDRWARVRDAAMRFVGALDRVDRLRIGTFGSEIALSPHLTGDKAVLGRVLREELWPGGSTPLWTAMQAAIQSLAGEGGRRTIVMVTDGVDTSGARHAQVAERAVKERFMVYAIGLEGKGLGPRLVDLIGETGGGRFDLKKGDDLGTAFLNIADELRHQYLIGFTPEALDGLAHTLDVRVNRPGFTVRAPKQFVATVKK